MNDIEQEWFISIVSCGFVAYLVKYRIEKAMYVNKRNSCKRSFLIKNPWGSFRHSINSKKKSLGKAEFWYCGFSNAVLLVWKTWFQIIDALYSGDMDWIPKFNRFRGCGLSNYRFHFRPYRYRTNICRGAYTLFSLFSMLHSVSRRAWSQPSPLSRIGFCHIWVFQCAFQDHWGGLESLGKNFGSCSQFQTCAQKQTICVSSCPSIFSTTGKCCQTLWFHLGHFSPWNDWILHIPQLEIKAIMLLRQDLKFDVYLFESRNHII